MLLVIDANIVVASLIKEGKVREIIMSEKFSLVSPDYLLSEIHKYREYIRQKAGLTETEMDALLETVLKRIKIIPRDRYQSRIAEAGRIMDSDINDVPYVACYLQVVCDGIWTNDSDYSDKRGINIVSTDYLLGLV